MDVMEREKKRNCLLPWATDIFYVKESKSFFLTEILGSAHAEISTRRENIADLFKIFSAYGLYTLQQNSYNLLSCGWSINGFIKYKRINVHRKWLQHTQNTYTWIYLWNWPEKEPKQMICRNFILVSYR